MVFTALVEALVGGIIFYGRGFLIVLLHFYVGNIFIFSFSQPLEKKQARAELVHTRVGLGLGLGWVWVVVGLELGYGLVGVEVKFQIC